MEREQEGMNFCDYFLCGGWTCSCGCVHLCTQALVHLSVFVFVYRLEVNVGIFLNHSPPYWGWGGKFSFSASPKLGWQAGLSNCLVFFFFLSGYWGSELKASCLLCRYLTTWAIFPALNCFIFWGHQMTPLLKGLALQNQSLRLISRCHRGRKQLTSESCPLTWTHAHIFHICTQNNKEDKI